MPFNGKATYDNFAQIGEDISDILMMISARETPFLDLLPAPDEAATSIYHGWSEELLGPDRIISSTVINSVAAGSQTPIQTNGFGNQLQVGMILELESTAGGVELTQISSIVGANSVVLLRGFGGTTPNSLVAGGTLFIVSTAEQEGSETSGDVHRPRTRRYNYTQIFKKPITLSGTDQAVVTAPGVGSEFDHQTTLRAMELARDLEKAVFRSVSLNTIGGDDVYRTMAGLRSQLTAINSTITTSSFAGDPIGYVNNLMQAAWNVGTRDLDVLVLGGTWKKHLSNTNAAKLQVTQDERGIERLVEFVTTDFGQLRVLLTPWLPDESLMGLSTRRIKVVPLRGRSFQREMLAKTGDSFKGHIIGEYTLETHHPDKMFQAVRP